MYVDASKNGNKRLRETNAKATIKHFQTSFKATMDELCERCVRLRNVPEELDDIQCFIDGDSDRGYYHKYVDLYREDETTWIVLFKHASG